MKKIVEIILIFLSVMLIQACSESFIDLPYENGTVDINFFQTPLQAEQAVTGVYSQLNDPSLWVWYGLAMGEDPSDEVVELHGDPQWLNWTELDQYTYTPLNSFISSNWSGLYHGIQKANYVITKVPGIKSLDADLMKRYVAEAKTLRALFYYQIVINWGDAPLFLEPTTIEITKNATRNPALEIWTQIIKDLNEAKVDLPDSYPASEVGRVTKGFANGLLSRVYLWTKEYDKATQAAQAVVGSPHVYALEANYRDLFDGTVENGKEILLDVQNVTGRPGETQWTSGSYNKIFYWMSNYKWSYFLGPSREFIDNAFEAGDLRKKASILDMKAGDTYDMNGDGIINNQDVIPPVPTNARIIKGLPKKVNLNLASNYKSGAVQWVNVHIMRYAEVLLNLADALNEQNQSSQALTYINKVRTRAGLPNLTSTNQSELRNAILKERATELCFEGFRFYDLKRAGKLQEVLGPLGFTSGKNEVFPIPQRDIDLTQMEQNTGY
ncbi:MAG: RagB/SusD family nutrient uptake outer membrane protein [Ignavibacteria bacterium]|nr:RagB/SusD family nutrient uptake outer membrane protein [Ignavibacteria bacterium]